MQTIETYRLFFVQISRQKGFYTAGEFFQLPFAEILLTEQYDEYNHNGVIAD